MTKNIRKGGRTGKTNANPPEENITYSKLSGFHEQDTSTYKNMEKKKEKVGEEYGKNTGRRKERNMEENAGRRRTESIPLKKTRIQTKT